MKPPVKHLAVIVDKDITGKDALSNADPRIAVDVFLFDEDNRVALLYLSNWDIHTIPGGGVEFGEDLVTAAKREILEETGCNCEILLEIGTTFESRAAHDFTQQRHYFVARVVGEKGEPHLTEAEILQGAAVHWYPIGQALEIIKETKAETYQQKYIKARNIVALTEIVENYT